MCELYAMMKYRIHSKVLRLLYIQMILTISVLCGFFALSDVRDKGEKADEKAVFAAMKDTYYADMAGLSERDLYALSAVLIDGDSGRVLFSKDGFTARPMASTTKIMTLIVALENSNEDDTVTVSSYAAKMPDVQLGMEEGEQYRLGDLYYSLMLESHNDTAVAIAEHVGGSVQDFAAMMNKKAKELGLSQTYFITPNGLDAQDDTGVHSTSANDLAQIMRYCILQSPKKEEFIRITQAREASFGNLKGTRVFHVYNRNAYLDKNQDAISGKTGFTCDAGYCYVGAVENNGRTFIVALLGCGWPNNKNYKWSDMGKLVKYGEDNYEMRSVIFPDYETGSVHVLNGIGTDRINTYTDADLTLLLSETDDVKIRVNMPGEIEAPVRSGEVLGKIDITINDYLYASYPVYSGDSAERKDFMYWLRYTVMQFLF